MIIVVAGCGKIGSTIVSSLAAEGHDVIALDTQKSVLDRINDQYDIMVVCGSCTDFNILSEADVGRAELFVAVTDSDEVNMLSCFFAKRLGASHTIARIRNKEFDDRSLGFIRKQLDIDVAINPDFLAAREIYNILKLPPAMKIERFSGRNFEMIELRLKSDSLLDGMSLKEVRERYKVNVLFCAVQRGEEVYIPDGSFVLRSGDKLGLTAAPSEFQKFFKAVSIRQKQAKDIMILGGSRTAYYLASLLANTGTSVKIIERDRNICNTLSETLPSSKVMIIEGDGSGQETLLEEGLCTKDAFVALTGIDEENILISIFAAAKQVGKVIAKVNSGELARMAENLGLDCIISPKQIIADVLVSYARALENSLGSSVETLYKLMDGKAEALEFIVRADSPVADIPLKDLNLKPNILIAGIVRGRKVIIPSGSDIITAYDKVIVIAANIRLNDLSDILK